jgi:hypothetical protein
MFTIHILRRYCRICGLLGELFLFPVAYCESKRRETAETYRIPENLLVVTVISDTGKIYAVSENSAKIINRPATSLIDGNFSDLFAESGGFFILLSADKSKHRSFQGRQLVHETLTEYFLCEDTNSLFGIANPGSFASQLANFVPGNFAEAFSAGLSGTITFEPSFYVWFRVDPHLPLNLVEGFFNAFLSLSKSFQNAKLIRIRGAVVTVALPHSVIGSLFFVRTVYQTRNCEAALAGVLIDLCGEAHFAIDATDVPFVESDNELEGKNERLVAWVPKGFIAVACIGSLPRQFGEIETIKTDVPPLDQVAVMDLGHFLKTIESLAE